MSVEATVFILRLLAGLSLIGFLLALFVIIWRGFNRLQERETPPEFGTIARESPEADGEGERWNLRPLVTLGRGGGNTIMVADDFASAEHARILLENGRWWLEDRQSRNGTHLNETRLTRRAILADGDVIGIGQHRYRIHLPSGAAKIT